MLLGITLFHRHTFPISLCGLLTMILYKSLVGGYKTGSGMVGLAMHLEHEWVSVANLFCLLMGFAILARHFEKSHVPVILPRYLPHDWTGGLILLLMVFVLSSFLDNIAAALIGGAMAHQLYRAKVHLSYIAAIVAASNAGGSGSVLGDTTTTMMWLRGVAPSEIIFAYIAAIVAVLVSAVIAARRQQQHEPILKSAHAHTHVDWRRIYIILLILVFAVCANVFSTAIALGWSERFPVIGIAVWLAIFFTMGVRRHDWEVLGQNLKGTLFLLNLVLCASLMPVEQLPAASWITAFILGFVSAVFDNIPLTALALDQGGYDWGALAFAVGFSGSIIWFGSSAGVALSNMYPQAKSVTAWLRHGWHVVIAYVAGFIVLMATHGWVVHTRTT